MVDIVLAFFSLMVSGAILGGVLYLLDLFSGGWISREFKKFRRKR